MGCPVCILMTTESNQNKCMIGAMKRPVCLFLIAVCKTRDCYGSRMITVFGFPGRRFPSLSRRVKKRGCYGNRMITVSGFFGYSVSLTTGPDGNFALRLSQTAPAYMLYRRCAMFGRRYYAVSAVCADCHLKRILF